MKLAYKKNGVGRVSEVVSWGAFPVPVAVPSRIVSAGDGSGPGVGVALVGFAIVLEYDTAFDRLVPVVISLENTEIEYDPGVPD